VQTKPDSVLDSFTVVALKSAPEVTLAWTVVKLQRAMMMATIARIVESRFLKELALAPLSCSVTHTPKIDQWHRAVVCNYLNAPLAKEPSSGFKIQIGTDVLRGNLSTRTLQPFRFFSRNPH
jgi:hypothetical protein